MDGTDRAALLLLSIGEESAVKVLKQMQPKQVQKIGQSMAKLSMVGKQEVNHVIEDFFTQIEKQTNVDINVQEFAKNVFHQALGKDYAASYIDRLMSTESENGLDRLRWLDAKSVNNLIRNEHPQVVATVLINLDCEQAAEILSLIPEDKRTGIVLRMSALKSVKPEVLEELGNVINSLLSNQKRSAESKIVGIKQVADILNNVDSSVETKLLESLKSVDESLCEIIKENMFVFDNLAGVTETNMQKLIQKLSSDDMILALKGSDEIIKEKFFNNMSKRAAEIMRDDLDAKGPVKVSDVEKAQKKILVTARKLAEDGEITLRSKGSDEMI